LVGDEARGGDNDLVAGVEQGSHGEVERLRDPHTDDELRLGMVGHAIQTVQVGGKRLTQL
jgi:hypothetical protein